MKKIGRKILSTLTDWKDSLISVPLLVTLWLVSPYILTDVDSPDAPAGWGPIYLQKVIFAAAIVFVSSFVSWMVVKVHRSEVFKFSNEENPEPLTRWQKNLLLLGWFSLFSLVFVIALTSL